MKLKPVATVKNGIHEDVEDWDKVESRLVFDRAFVPGLYRLDEMSHILVIFGFHKKRGYSLKVHPMHDPSRPLLGVFASRSPRRPNRLGLTRARLVRVEGNTVTVRGLDAYDGSPVFDIKPPEREVLRRCQRGPKK
jgi:tRNA-Thr(GGU) m(6)t(6)A37 methyltransferase TsaA